MLIMNGTGTLLKGAGWRSYCQFGCQVLDDSGIYKEERLK